MIPLARAYELNSSFAKLKKTARADSDIIQWFRDNAYCLPNVPGPLIPHLSVAVDDNNSFLGLNLDDEHVERRLVLVYEAQIPYELPPAVTEESFREIVATNFRVRGNTQKTPSFWGTLQLYLNPVEWNYVAAMAGWDILRNDNGRQSIFKDRTLEVWDNIFPEVPWTMIEKLDAAGLTPDSEPQFISWLCNDPNKLFEKTNIPIDLAP